MCCGAVRCQVDACLAADAHEVAGRGVLSWGAPPADVLRVLGPAAGVPPHAFAAALADWPPARLAPVLELLAAAGGGGDGGTSCLGAGHQRGSSGYVAAACTSWPEEQLEELLPLLSAQLASQVRF
jgi:hypothetical protein